MKTPAEIDDVFRQIAMRRWGIGLDEWLAERIAAAIQSERDEHAAQVKELRDLLPRDFTAAKLRAIAVILGDSGYHVTHSKSLYAWAEWLETSERLVARAVLARTEPPSTVHAAEKSARP